MSMSNIVTQHLLSFKNSEWNVKGKPDKNSWGNQHRGIVIYLKPSVCPNSISIFHKQQSLVRPVQSLSACTRVHFTLLYSLEFIIITAVSACNLYSSTFLESLEWSVFLLLMYISQLGVTLYLKHFWAWSNKGKILYLKWNTDYGKC